VQKSPRLEQVVYRKEVTPSMEIGIQTFVALERSQPFDRRIRNERARKSTAIIAEQAPVQVVQAPVGKRVLGADGRRVLRDANENIL
jgi:hypothetical protein